MNRRLKLELGETTRQVTVTSAVDKIDGFIYYTLNFDADNWVVLSRFDGEQWHIANHKLNDSFAAWLGDIVEAMP